MDTNDLRKKMAELQALNQQRARAISGLTALLEREAAKNGDSGVIALIAVRDAAKEEARKAAETARQADARHRTAQAALVKALEPQLPAMLREG